MADKMFTKVVISGDIVEVYEYEGPVFYNYKKRKEEKEDVELLDKETGEMYETFDEMNEEKERKKQEMLEEVPENLRHLFDRKKEYRKLAVYRARTTLRRLILANFDHESKFVTLTFRDGSIPDVTDVKRANQEFNKFIKRLKYYLVKRAKEKGVEEDMKNGMLLEELKYATVVEFQDKNGRGAVHYHMICNLSWLPHKELEKLWRHGWVGINSLKAKMRDDGKDVDNVGAYMIKYMIKDFNDPRLKAQKMYFTSRGLKRPVELKGMNAASFLWLNQFDKREKVFTSEYESEYHGLIQYREYNLKRSGATLNFKELLTKAQ
jgi:hypothetical protein